MGRPQGRFREEREWRWGAPRGAATPRPPTALSQDPLGPHPHPQAQLKAGESRGPQSSECTTGPRLVPRTLS